MLPTQGDYLRMISDATLVGLQLNADLGDDLGIDDPLSTDTLMRLMLIKERRITSDGTFSIADRKSFRYALVNIEVPFCTGGVYSPYWPISIP